MNSAILDPGSPLQKGQCTPLYIWIYGAGNERLAVSAPGNEGRTSFTRARSCALHDAYMCRLTSQQKLAQIGPDSNSILVCVSTSNGAPGTWRDARQTICSDVGMKLKQGAIRVQGLDFLEIIGTAQGPQEGDDPI
jgi:hypothetical protein